MEILIGLTILYVIQATLVYGMAFGHLKSEFPTYNHVPFVLFMSLFAGIVPVLGPLVIFCLSGFGEHGMRYK